MNKTLHQATSFALPVLVLIVVPLCIEKNLQPTNYWTGAAGLLIMAAGLYIITSAVSGIIRTGKGTLAPWYPAGHLVTGGMYAYVRNPMILGVLTVLAGESLAVQSCRILIWAGCFFVINTIFFVVYEEPVLEKKFGDEYRDYKKHVRRWIPRLKPYKPGSTEL